MKILIAYDGSALADEAIEDLDLAGMPEGTEALVVSAAKPWSFMIEAGGLGAVGWNPITVSDIQSFDGNSLREAEVLSHRARNHLESKHPDWIVRAESCLDQPAAGILRKAEAWKPDLIVMGSHGRTALARMLMGSVAHKVLHHAACAVRINRARIRPAKRPPRLLVGVGGGAGEEHLIEDLAAREWPGGTQVHLLAVLETLVMPPDAASEDLQQRLNRFAAGRHEAILGKLEGYRDRISKKGIEAFPEVTEGDPRHMLLEKAAEWDADCLFLGSRNLNGLERILLGSVSDSIAVHAPCTVEVFRDRPAKSK
ncbi:MAG: universal stress protein [Fibrobacteria bacterium]